MKMNKRGDIFIAELAIMMVIMTFTALIVAGLCRQQHKAQFRQFMVDNRLARYEACQTNGVTQFIYSNEVINEPTWMK